jgi:hypothetical protein
MLQPVADEAGHVLLHMDRRLADVRMELHGEFDRGRRRPFGCDDLDQRHEVWRVPPVGAERAGAVVEAAHDDRDRDDGRIAGEDGIWAGRALDIGEEPLLDAEVLAHRLHDEIRLGHGFGEGAADAHAVHCGHIVAKVLEIGEDTILGASKRRRMAIRNGDVMAGEREYLGDAVAHQPSADHGDAWSGHRLLLHAFQCHAPRKRGTQ